MLVLNAFIFTGEDMVAGVNCTQAKNKPLREFLHLTKCARHLRV